LNLPELLEPRRKHLSTMSRAEGVRPAHLVRLGRFGYECGHLLDEAIEVAEVAEAGGDNVVRHLDVFMKQDISKSDGVAQCVRHVGREDIVTPEQPHRVTVVGRRAPTFRAARRDVLPAMNCGDSPCQSAVSIAAYAAIAVGRWVVEVRADRLCRFAGLRALMRATDLRDGGCLRPRRLIDAVRPDLGDPSTS